MYSQASPHNTPSRAQQGLRGASGARRFLLASTAALALVGSSASAQSLINGGSVSGVISTMGEEDSFTFTASPGEGYHVRVADVNTTVFVPEVQIYAPGGALVTGTWAGDVVPLTGIASTGGTYTVVVRDRNGTATGAYDVEFARAPGANEGGSLINGGVISDSIALGDVDSYTFGINPGEGFQFRVAATSAGSLVPQYWLYGPSGALVSSNWAAVTALNDTAQSGGTYTLVVADRNGAGTGDYDLYFVRAPGANEGGALVNGDVVSDTIDLGDLDSYTLHANAGEPFFLQVADVGPSALVPQLWVYGPGGNLLASNWGEVVLLNLTAPTSGTHTVVVADRSGGGTGSYDLYFTLRPGAKEGGLLVNGGFVSGTIDLGDLDSYTFEASWGESVQLRMVDVDTTVLVPQMWLYDPQGNLVSSVWSGDVAAITIEAAANGTYTLIAADRNGPGTGDYEIYYTRAPGANEGGALPNGGKVTDTIGLGDLDSYTFDAVWGDAIQLRIADLSVNSFVPQLWVYAPSGGLVASNWSGDVAALSFTAAATGTFTVVVADRNTPGVGAYDLYFVRAPGANEGGLMTNGGLLAGTVDLGDLDTFTLQALAGESVHLEVLDVAATALVPQVWLYSPTGALVGSAWAADLAILNATAPITGTYTVLVADRNGAGTGDYGVSFAHDLETYCTAGTSANGCTATMSGLGEPSVSAGTGFVVTASGGEGNKDGLYFFATNGRQASPWGNGTSYQCVVPPVKRSPTQGGGGSNGNCDGNYTLDFNALVIAQPAKAPPVGAVVQMQAWYRDPFNTSNQSTSLSDAIEFTMRP